MIGMYRCPYLLLEREREEIEEEGERGSASQFMLTMSSVYDNLAVCQV